MKFNRFIQLTVFFVIFFLSSILAEKIGIDIEQIGYGKTNKEVYFGIYNTGDVRLTDIEIWVDGVLREVVGGKLSPGSGFQKNLYLEFGDHFIEVKTPEGAYDSINITTAAIQEKNPQIEINGEEKSFIEKNKVWISLLLIAMVTIIIFLLLKRPKLKLES